MRQIKYTVRFRRVTGILRPWRRLKNVTGDFVVTSQNGAPTSCRGFILESGERVELCTSGMEFRFSPEREELVRQNMSREAGQQVQ